MGTWNLPRFMAALAAAVGVLALVGWALNISELKSVLPGLAQMKANTAICAVLAGTSLWLISAPRGIGTDRLSRGGSRVAAALVVMIGGLTLAQYAFGWTLGIDELLFRDDPGAPVTSAPGRMAPSTALAFLLVGSALLTSGMEPRTGARPAEWLALVAGIIPLAALVGYLYSATVLYQLFSSTGMAVHTAFALLLLSAGVLIARPDSILMSIHRAPGPAGRFVRTIVPALALATVVLGWLLLRAERAGYIGRETSVATMATSVIVILVVVVYLAASQAERLEDERSRAQELFQSAVDASPNGMLMVDPTGRIVLANRQIEAIFGYAATELKGRPVETLLPTRHRDTHDGHRRGYLDQPEVRRMGVGRDLRALRKDGSEIPVEVGLNPVEREDGTFVLASIIDITLRKLIEEDLRRSNEELERFAYVASHDLQEPLRMVGSYVQLLAKRYRGSLDADADEFIDFALEGSVRAQQLIHELLAYSRVGTRGGDFVPTDTNDALGRALISLKIAIDEAGASVTSDSLPTLRADPVQLERVFLNLVSNAIKFRDAGPPEVRVSAALHDDEWIFSVRDNGIGIEREYLEQIFVIFKRLHGRNEYAGTGMGLAITKKIVERHGGQIWAESTPGVETTFYFTLPAIKDV